MSVSLPHFLSMYNYVAEPPRITSHPQAMKDAVPGEPVKFTAEATGTEPLNYQWEWKPAQEEGRWQPCDVERFRGADSSTLTIPNQQKSNEGSYHCVISNSAGSQTSNSAEFSVGKNPIISAIECAVNLECECVTPTFSFHI